MRCLHTDLCAKRLAPQKLVGDLLVLACRSHEYLFPLIDAEKKCRKMAQEDQSEPYIKVEAVASFSPPLQPTISHRLEGDCTLTQKIELLRSSRRHQDGRTVILEGPLDLLTYLILVCIQTNLLRLQAFALASSRPLLTYLPRAHQQKIQVSTVLAKSVLLNKAHWPVLGVDFQDHLTKLQATGACLTARDGEWNAVAYADPEAALQSALAAEDDPFPKLRGAECGRLVLQVVALLVSQGPVGLQWASFLSVTNHQTFVFVVLLHDLTLQTPD
ncbi:hypothetical protein, conserved [Eimeria tenella]|uniref:Uncharacterized protein n=1 Tax=Eimeria tenella TaxID=5802 RepID=U6KUF4_EIMTE|nr:hypothetical protein, conserved [Eimeria tenella]CDJ41586.1 hypothetical protein, conserved [Eimeria tenella]|eukprot:XP_013232336.1 hypothetical protein, conserved [Eimeria tenella]